MKKIFLLIALALTATLPAHAQEQPTSEDTAARIVQNYMQMLNYDGLRRDSIFYIATTVTERNKNSDTVYMFRWMMGDGFRVEVWDHDTLQSAMFTDGKKVFRSFDGSSKLWVEYSKADFYDKQLAYDIRGPLYQWKIKGGELSYLGESSFQGHPVLRVKVGMPNMFDREYIFEKESGLLVLILESDHMFGDEKADMSRHVEWRAYHEFLPFGKGMVPHIESYLAHGHLMVMTHTAQYVPPRTKIFQEAKP